MMLIKSCYLLTVARFYDFYSVFYYFNSLIKKDFTDKIDILNILTLKQIFTKKSQSLRK